MENTFFCDLGKAAFGTLDLCLDTGSSTEIEAVIGECCKNGCIDRSPGGWRFAHVQKIALSPGINHCRFPLPKRPPCRNGALTSPLDEEIAPFRYVEINGNCRVISVKRNEIFPESFNDDDAIFVSSDEKLNQVWEFCKYSIKATAAFGLFVDGDRERQPYEGDDYINQLGWFCCCADGKIPCKTIDYLLKVPTWPTEWQLLMPVIARDYLLYTGDCDSIARWLPILKERLLDQWVGDDALLYTDSRNPRDIVDWPDVERDGYEFGSTNLVPNCYRYGALLAMAELTDDRSYRQKAELLRQAIRKKMLVNGRFVDSPESNHTAIHSRMFPLFFGVGTPEECSGIAQCGMACSVYGAQFLLDSMFNAGMEYEALKLITSEGERSWLNMIKQGSTISMEAWSNETKPNQDWNHAWGAAPANLIPRCIAGIRPLEPGFRKFAVTPHPAGLKQFFMQIPIAGNRKIKVEYLAGNLQITVPENSYAVVKEQQLPPGFHQVQL